MGVESEGDEVQSPEFGEGGGRDLGRGARQESLELLGGVRFQVKAVLERVVDGLDADAAGGNEGPHRLRPGGRRAFLLAGGQQQAPVERRFPVARPDRRAAALVGPPGEVPFALEPAIGHPALVDRRRDDRPAADQAIGQSDPQPQKEAVEPPREGRAEAKPEHELVYGGRPSRPRPARAPGWEA